MVPQGSIRPTQSSNRLLSALPEVDYGRLESDLTLIDLVTNDVIHEAGAPVMQVFFPFSGMISLVASTDGNASLEAGTVGREGMAGLSLAARNGEWPCEAMVQISGRAARLPGASLRREIELNGALARLMECYTQSVLVQCMQSMTCLHFHNIEQRLCRWLLATQDQIDAERLPLTQEFLAMMLGVRRASVTMAATALQRDGVIRYRRGLVTIVDRPALETRACGCYTIMRRHIERVTDAPVEH